MLSSSGSADCLVREMPRLPFLGLGLSSKLDASGRPRPFQLLAKARDAFDYIEYSAPLSIDQARAEASLFPELEAMLPWLPALLHPSHLNLYGPELEDESALAELNRHALVVRSPWVSNDVAWWHTNGCEFPGHLYIAPTFDDVHARDVAVHALHVQAGLDMPLLLENPNVLATRGTMHVLEFMSSIRERTGLGLLLDLGHLASYQLSRNQPLDSGLNNFDFDGVVEVHVAGGTVVALGNRRFYVDDHSSPLTPEALKLLELIVPRCRNLCALTFEGEGQSEEHTLEVLARLKPMTDSARKIDIAIPKPKLIDRDKKLPRGASERAWSIYQECYQSAAGTDLLGAYFERELRLRVLTDRLARTMPRLLQLFASQIHEFINSEEMFSGTNTIESFAHWTRKKLVAQPNATGARVWAEEVVQRVGVR